MIDEEDRTAFIAGANSSLNSGRYPKLKLSVYFDSTDGNSGESCSIGNATWRIPPPFSDTSAVADGGPSNEPLYRACEATC